MGDESDDIIGNALRRELQESNDYFIAQFKRMVGPRDPMVLHTREDGAVSYGVGDKLRIVGLNRDTGELIVEPYMNDDPFDAVRVALDAYAEVVVKQRNTPRGLALQSIEDIAVERSARQLENSIAEYVKGRLEQDPTT